MENGWAEIGAFGLLSSVLFWIFKTAIPAQMKAWSEGMKALAEAVKESTEVNEKTAMAHNEALRALEKSNLELRISVVRMDARVRAQWGDTPEGTKVP